VVLQAAHLGSHSEWRGGRARLRRRAMLACSPSICTLAPFFRAKNGGICRRNRATTSERRPSPPSRASRASLEQASRAASDDKDDEEVIYLACTERKKRLAQDDNHSSLPLFLINLREFRLARLMALGCEAYHSSSSSPSCKKVCAVAFVRDIRAREDVAPRIRWLLAAIQRPGQLVGRPLFSSN